MLSPTSYELILGQVGHRLPAAALVLANLLPIYAVLQGSWEVGSLITLYWAENLIIGFYSLLKILLAGCQSPLSIVGSLLGAVFFCIHYGGFVGVHGLFVLQFFPLSTEQISLDDLHWPLFLVFPEILFRVTSYMFTHMPPLMYGGFLMLFVSHGISFVVNHLIRGERHHTNDKALLFSPYGRIVVMHITIIAGAMLVMFMGSNLAFLLILIALKIGLDLKMHFKSHKRLNDKHNEKRALP